ncbi:hypothetical protein LEMLEM_LOCUS12368 [Lemmus lemmus]
MSSCCVSPLATLIALGTSHRSGLQKSSISVPTCPSS